MLCFSERRAFFGNRFGGLRCDVNGIKCPDCLIWESKPEPFVCFCFIAFGEVCNDMRGEGGAYVRR